MNSNKQKSSSKKCFCCLAEQNLLSNADQQSELSNFWFKFEKLKKVAFI